MTKPTFALALILGLAAPMAFAEDAPAPAAPAATTPAADGPGTTYIAATEGDWQVQCLKTADGKDPCEMFQLLKDKDGNKIASISVMALPKGQEAVAGATITTPLESLLTAGVGVQIDKQKPVALPYNFCSKVGCFANVAMKANELDLLKKGNAIAMTVVPVAAPDKKVELSISLKGFSAAFDAASKNVAK